MTLRPWNVVVALAMYVFSPGGLVFKSNLVSFPVNVNKPFSSSSYLSSGPFNVKHSLQSTATRSPVTFTRGLFPVVVGAKANRSECHNNKFSLYLQANSTPLSSFILYRIYHINHANYKVSNDFTKDGDHFSKISRTLSEVHANVPELHRRFMSEIPRCRRRFWFTIQEPNQHSIRV